MKFQLQLFYVSNSLIAQGSFSDRTVEGASGRGGEWGKKSFSPPHPFAPSPPQSFIRLIASSPHRLIIFFLLPISYCLLPIFLLGCGDEIGGNHPPEIFKFEVSSKIVEPGAAVRIVLKSGDVDGDPLEFRWETSGGKLNTTNSGGEWIAPAEEGRQTISVKVSDGKDSTSRSLLVLVWKARPGDYYPLAVGNKWIYKDDQGNQITFTVVDTINVQIDSKGTKVKSFVLEKTNSSLPDFIDYSYLSKSSSQVDQNASSVGTNDTIIFVPALPLYKFPLVPSDSWKQEFRVKTPDGFFVGDGTAEYEVFGEETVVVPAGSFKNVLKVRERFKWELIGRSIDETISDKWLAPNVGLVKFTNEQTRGGETFMVEARLESYELK